jgi:hypothetical protein
MITEQAKPGPQRRLISWMTCEGKRQRFSTDPP